MGKPPADADPEKYIIGSGSYNNCRTARPYHDDRVFRIDPVPMPVWSIVAHNVVFAAFFFGVHWLVKHHSRGDAEPWAVYGAPLGVGLFTCIGFTWIACYLFAQARRLGAWLIYDKATGRVTLPREGESFERGEIIHLQYITTRRLQLHWDSDQLSELNLITCRDGERKRWPLLRSQANVWAFDWLVKPIMEHTELPVVRIKGGWWSWDVTETPYGHTAGK